MTPDPTIAATAAASAVDLATTKENLKGLGEDVEHLGRRVGGLEQEMRKGFQTISSDFQRVSNEFSREISRVSAPKGVQWPMVSMFVVVALALVSWAANYFGKDINAIAKDSAAMSERMSVISDRVYQQGVEAAKKAGADEVERRYTERERDRMRLELDRMQGAAKVAGS